MRVLVATDKFAGTLTAPEACNAVAAGWGGGRPGDAVRCVPMADGGPGTVAVVAAAGRGTSRVSATIDQRGRAVRASWLSLDQDTALIEVSSACGLHLVPPTERRPEAFTTEGVGRLLAEVLARGHRKLIVGLGGSGTVDGGLGAAVGMGAEARDPNGAPLSLAGPAAYEAVAAVTPLPIVPPEVLAATDVSNPLLGPAGAARVFGPQKGADPVTVELLESRISHLADVVERSLPGGPWRDLPGAGAAGGLGFGLMAWTGARLVGGAELVAGLVDLEEHVAWADVVITGEGSLDDQTLGGKAPAHVAAVARRAGRPVAAVAGRAAGQVVSQFTRVEVLGEDGMVDPDGAARRAGARLASSWR